MESISWRNLTSMRLVKFWWLELLKQGEEGVLSLVQFLCGSPLEGGHLDVLRKLRSALQVFFLS